MPADEGLRLNDYQRLSPVEQARPKYQGEACGVGELTGLNLVFPVECQLLTQEQYFRTQGSPGTDCQSQKLYALDGDGNKENGQRSEELRGLEHVSVE